MKIVKKMLSLIPKASIFWLLTDKSKLPGLQFDKYGRKLGLYLLMKRAVAPYLLLNPVSIVRYFEFDYVYRGLNRNLNDKKILDISSPFLFSFFLANKYNLNYYYVNPDIRDLNNIIDLMKILTFRSNYNLLREDATKLKVKDNFFDHIISISVIEHINSKDDIKALQQMWKKLKIGGKLILTFPVKKYYEEEYRYINVYGLTVDKENGKYFFQRFYDENSISNRLLNALTNYKILSNEIFGEKVEFYKEYEKRWMKYGLFETVKDPYYITKYFQTYSSINQLDNRLGIMGITLRKEK